MTSRRAVAVTGAALSTGLWNLKSNVALCNSVLHVPETPLWTPVPKILKRGGHTKASAVAAQISGHLSSGVDYYVARSNSSEVSLHKYIVAEKLHQFALFNGEHGVSDCSTFCAYNLVPFVCQAFVEMMRQQQKRESEFLVTDPEKLQEEGVAKIWSAASWGPSKLVTNGQHTQMWKVDVEHCYVQLLAVAFMLPVLG
eukprot:gnl/MRDRNA2_/MRDRNA2_54596_c0_seq1.p1 gnl/MRDRNA2_/MRDRNA2_54596_c0~~gnl/MRDRNA2_/MRDRNA2_54596_c0_seq1.p1  ORF type:complete len:198 (-),score=37.43 gnl/MRDRNA2_/MRDRNA2_54596_c0_seq1:359-952(-)